MKSFDKCKWINESYTVRLVPFFGTFVGQPGFVALAAKRPAFTPSKTHHWPTMRKSLTALTFALRASLLFLIPAAAVAQVALQNPSFESPSLAEGQIATPGQIVVQGSQTQFSTHFPIGYGWQATGGVALVRGELANATARFAPPMGRQWISLRPATTISQSVSLAAGTYNVSLSAMQGMDQLADMSLRVSVGAQQVTLVPQNLSSAVSGTGVPKLIFAGFTIATAGSYTLRIEVPPFVPGIADGYSSVWLDDVVVSNAAANSAPSVEVTYPSNGQAISATVIPLRATAIDTDSNTITKVEFYDLNTSASVPLGTVTQAPWNFSLVTSTAATRRIVARAYDGVTSTTSAEVVFTHNPGSAFPYVLNGTFENPLLGQNVSVYGSSISGWQTSPFAGVAAASAPFSHGGALTQPLEGLQSAVINPESAGENIQQSVAGLPAGNLGLSFRASIPAGQSVVAQAAAASAIFTPSNGGRNNLAFNMPVAGSAVVKFLVPTAGTSPILIDDVRVGPAGIPTAIVTSPVNNQVFDAPTAITLIAKLDSFDRSITAVEFFANGIVSIGTAIEPFAVTWFNPPAGVHSITVRVKDSLSNGAVSVISAPVSVTVNPGPNFPGFFNGAFEYWSGQDSSRPFSVAGAGWHSSSLPSASSVVADLVNGSAPEGISAAILLAFSTMPAWISQDVPLQPGSYKISMQAAVQPACSSPVMTILVNGLHLGTTFTPGNSFATITSSASFNVASTSTNTIRIEASSANTCRFNIDDLKIVTQTGGIPGAPVINTATPGNTSATVTFAAPVNGGGSAFT